MSDGKEYETEGKADGPTRDLEAARAAYDQGDADASKAAHDVSGALNAKEQHGGEASGYIKSIVFGGMDGIITTFAIVAAVAGGGLSTEVVILLGFSNLLADAISMGLGDYLSTKAEHEHIFAERAREEWEYDNYREGEIKEMVELYIKAGFSEADARTILETMAKEQYRDFFIDHMMVQELGLNVPDEDDNPAKDGLVTFCSFIVFGSVPMWFYVFFHIADWSDNTAQFIIACFASAATMFLLGWFKAVITKMNRIRSGALMLLNGGCATVAAFLVGYGLEAALDIGDNCAA